METYAPRRHVGTLVAVTLGRIAFGYQVQNVASLGPDLSAAFGIDFATLGTLIGLYLLPGVAVCVPIGFLARRFGDARVIGAGFALMAVGSLVSGLAAGPVGIGVGRVIAGSGAVALTVLQGKVVADRFAHGHFTVVLGLVVGAFPVGVGIGQLTQVPLAHEFGWPAAFMGGSVLALLALGVFATTWRPAAAAAVRTLSWPSRHECALVIVAGMVWTAYNAGFANFLGYMPSYLAAHGHPRWVANTVLTLATWCYLPATLAGGWLAVRAGVNRVFILGTLVGIVVTAGVGVVDWPLIWGGLFGTLAALHPGLIVAFGTLSARPENRAVGMGLFYTTYYLGGAVIPAICGWAADAMGDPAGAFLCAAALYALALPLYWLHRRIAGH